MTNLQIDYFNNYIDISKYTNISKYINSKGLEINKREELNFIYLNKMSNKFKNLLIDVIKESNPLYKILLQCVNTSTNNYINLSYFEIFNKYGYLNQEELWYLLKKCNFIQQNKIICKNQKLNWDNISINNNSIIYIPENNIKTIIGSNFNFIPFLKSFCNCNTIILTNQKIGIVLKIVKSIIKYNSNISVIKIYISFQNCFEYNINKYKKFIKDYDEIINETSCTIIINDKYYNISMLKYELDINEEYSYEDYKEQNDIFYDYDDYNSS